MSSQVFVQSNDAEQVEMLKGVFRKTLGMTASMMLVEIHMEPNTQVPAHSHPHEQVGYVVSGEIVFNVGGVEQRLTAGDSYAIPGHVEHSAQAMTQTVLLDIFAPHREEYRPPTR